MAGQVEKKKLGAYFVSQLVGAILGTLICNFLSLLRFRIFSAKHSNLQWNSWFWGSGFGFCHRNNWHIYLRFWSPTRCYSWLYERITFQIFFHQPYASCCSIVIHILYSFTFRKGCLNPAVAIAFQIFAAGSQQNFSLFYSIFGMVIGQVIGAILSAIFFTKFYNPLLKEIEEWMKKKKTILYWYYYLEL